MNVMCAATVYYKGGSHRGSPCSHRASVERDGKWYCLKHDPIARQAKRDASFEKFTARANEQMDRAKWATSIAKAKDAVVGAAVQAIAQFVLEGGFALLPLRRALIELDAAQGIVTRSAETSEAKAPGASDSERVEPDRPKADAP